MRLARSPLGEALAALGSGCLALWRGPSLVALVYAATLVSALPFAISMALQLRQDLDRGQPMQVSGVPDAEWWTEYRDQASGWSTTLTPNVVGAVAPLGNISALLDGTPATWRLVFPFSVFLLTSAWVWAGVLHRLATPSTARTGFVGAANRHMTSVLKVNLLAVAVAALLYVTLHPLLFGPVFDVAASTAGSETMAFLSRVALYLMFGSLLAALSLMTDYARIITVSDSHRGIGAVVRETFARVRHRSGIVLILFIVTVVCFVLLVAGYAFLEIRGGARVGGWRAVLLGQVYLAGRVILRVINAAAQVQVIRAR